MILSVILGQLDYGGSVGQERSAGSYDDGYRENPNYRLDPDHAPWSQLWYWILGRIGEELILDLGCGAGHLAELLQRRSHPPHLYLGVDFSEQALIQARQRAPGYRFILDELPFASERAHRMSYPVVVFSEVLEHIEEDRTSINKLPDGTRILATVPTFDSSGHVRHFLTMGSVCNRYEPLVEFISIGQVGRVFVWEGRRRKVK